MGYSGIRILKISRGLGPGQPLLFAFVGGGGAVRKESPSLLGPFGPPQLERPSFFCLPQSVGEHLLLLLPRLRGKSVPQSHRTVSLTTPGVGNYFGFPWPSWSSPALYKGPESTSSPEERLRGLRAKEPDSRSVQPSSASPIKGTGV